jgi:hypothetical protein
MAEKESLVSRRNILVGLVGGGVAAVGGITVQQTSSGSDLAKLLNPVGLGFRRVSLATAERADWTLQVGTFFTAHTGHVLKLVKVQGFPQRGDRPDELRDTAFVASFDITSGAPLVGDQLLTVKHNEGGTFNMAVASGDPALPLRMLAVFN